MWWSIYVRLGLRRRPSSGGSRRLFLAGGGEGGRPAGVVWKYKVIWSLKGCPDILFMYICLWYIMAIRRGGGGQLQTKAQKRKLFNRLDNKGELPRGQALVSDWVFDADLAVTGSGVWPEKVWGRLFVGDGGGGVWSWWLQYILCVLYLKVNGWGVGEWFVSDWVFDADLAAALGGGCISVGSRKIINP